MARVLERVMSREVGGMMEGVQRVAGVAQAGGEGFALAGDGVRVDFSTGLRGGIGDSGNETADDGGGNDGQDGAGRGEGGEVNEEGLLQQELRSFRGRGLCRGRDYQDQGDDTASTLSGEDLATATVVSQALTLVVDPDKNLVFTVFKMSRQA